MLPDAPTETQIQITLSSILDEAKKTNGRVRKLEKFMWTCIGFTTCASIFTGLWMQVNF